MTPAEAGRLKHCLALSIGGLALLFSFGALARGERDRSFDADWRFLRGDAPGAERVDFDDSDWRALDLPHDWSIEDLPPADKTIVSVAVVEGKWRFHQGDDPGWKNPFLNDNEWQEVQLPDDWKHHSDITQDNAFGWFRRHIRLPGFAEAKELELLLGKIADADETYLNGVRIGGLGSFPPNFQTARDQERRYRVPARLARGDGTDVVAVRVFAGVGNGGIYEAGSPVGRAGPFDPGASAGGASTGHVLGGTGWYRKHFRLDAAEAGKAVSVRFDGVYMDAEIWVNGQSLGTHPYGYTSFAYDLTPHLSNAGQENVLAVRVRNEGKNSRWYSGSGIYRHVWLTVTDPLHVALWGVQVTTPQASSERAVVKVATTIAGPGSGADVSVRTRLIGPNGRVVRSAQSSARFQGATNTIVEQVIDLPSPQLWDLSTPRLYGAEVELVAGGTVRDRCRAAFGIRKLEADAEHGLRLNGQPLKLKGGCVHHDNGPLGSAAIDRAEERRVELLKANGFNAIRTSHNPPSPAFLDACDRLGVLVIDEAFDQWAEAKNPQDYHRFFQEWSGRDIAAMVERDRNHPSIVLWSVGNEVHERFARPDQANALRQAVLARDRTRPVTAAICDTWDWPGLDWDKVSDPAFQSLDVGGYNYLPDKYESDHARNPQRVIVGTESFPLDAFHCWAMVEKHPYVIGDFVWTALDYLGEAGLGHTVLDNEKNPQLMPWPWFDAWCGDLDICGFKKPQSFYRDVVWGRSNIAIAVHTPLAAGRSEKVSLWGWPDELQSWSWPVEKDTPMQVAVYSTCDKVRLELNGKKLGDKSVSAGSKLTARFEVPYAPGLLRAVGLVNGQEVASVALRSAGPPKKLRLTVDRPEIRADRNDLAYVTVEVVDAAGERVPFAAVPVRFAAIGAGELAAVGSGNPCDPSSFRGPERTTFQGRCLAILRPAGEPGKITLKAEAENLSPATVTVRCVGR
ncbi:MAG TPA: glycoside hydrolase family 2 TIM barrel-domain containing protein [Dongiaceae bacterium]|nr:glycoside hydrolase family 2 TIM barrel-domain containing protein [Dongiaceae bacterium]